MAQTGIFYSISVSLLLSMVVLILQVVEAVPTVFIFGDSVVDVGTNIFLPESRAKCNISHHGIDFPGSKPNGRCSNGFNVADTIVQEMGYKRSPPPYLYLVYKRTSTLKRDIVHGANFASGGAGLFDKTGQFAFGKVLSMEDQVQQFRDVRGNLSSSVLSNSIVLICMGNNDLVEHFFLNPSTPSREYLNKVIKKYEYHLKNLLHLGVRKLGILSIPPIGCVPFERFFNPPTQECKKDLNSYAQIFNKAIETILKKLSSEYKGMKYSFGDSYEMTMAMFKNPRAYGFKEIKEACCGDAVTRCSPTTKLCRYRNEYLFWDSFHPTQKAAELAARTLYIGTPNFVRPVNFRQLVEATV